MNRLQSFIQEHSKLLISLAVVIRIILVIYGSVQDELFEVKYSDVDYQVVTDAARLVVEKKSPYKRTTYRYSPLLAYLLVPNVTVHPSFGKFLFVGFDLIAAFLVFRLVLASRLSEKQAMNAAVSWLWNPLSMTISTRGSGDSIICSLVLMTLLGLVSARNSTLGPFELPALGWVIIGAIAYGISVHWRIYPIIFAPSILLHLANLPHQVLFSLVSGYVFVILGIVFYFGYSYGYTFLYETFLYHFIRTDHRHNFSAWFYALYLGLSADMGRTLGFFSFLPQLVVQISLIRKFASKDIVFCFFLQTWAFVTFNKVITAQYFLWYVSLLPVAAVSMKMRPAQLVLTIVLPWILSEVHWLAWAYRIEFLGTSSFEGVFGAGLVFFLVNVYSIVKMIRSHSSLTDDDNQVKNKTE